MVGKHDVVPASTLSSREKSVVTAGAVVVTAGGVVVVVGAGISVDVEEGTEDDDALQLPPLCRLRSLAVPLV